MRFFIIVLIFCSSLFSQEDKENPLKPNKFETPRETFQVFLKAMNDYKKGIETDDAKMIAEIDTAVRCLNLESVSYLIRAEKGKEVAVFLKEVLDRVSSIDSETIPILPIPPELKIQKWILDNTEISIQLVDTGERKDEYLFSKDTVFRAYEFYKKTKHLPYLKRTGGGALYKEPWSERYLPAYARIRVFQIYIWQILGIFLAIIFGILLRGLTKFVSKFIIRILHRIPDSKVNWKEKLLIFCDKPLAQIVTIGFWYFCLNILDFEGAVLKFFSMILQILLSYNLVRFFYDLSKAFTEYLEQKAAQQKDEDSIFDSQIIPFISRSTRVVIIIIGTLMTVQNLGINVMSILAGLGVGGLAFALAARDMAANLFGSVMILLDRPFKIGDSVIISAIEGDVEEIGFRCTRLRTLNDSLVSIPNAEVS